MTIKIPLIAAGLIAALSTSALASDLQDRVEDRQSYQMKRIEQGRKDGTVTWTEGIKLRAEQRRIEAAEQAFKSDDGRIDRQEFQQLKQMQDEASKHIFAESHDSKNRPSWLPRIGK